jgi:hypothetical protein
MNRRMEQIEAFEVLDSVDILLSGSACGWTEVPKASLRRPRAPRLAAMRSPNGAIVTWSVIKAGGQGRPQR